MKGPPSGNAGQETNSKPFNIMDFLSRKADIDSAVMADQKSELQLRREKQLKKLSDFYELNV
jgi:hypothetical protein